MLIEYGYDKISIMIIPDKYVYLLALIPFCLIWAFLFFKRKDLRKEIILTSFFIGILSVLTSYFWWTKDWWRPLTVTGTIVGFEDFIMGFTSGGIMSVIYDYIFRKKYQKVNLKNNIVGAFFVLLFMAIVTGWLFISIGLTSFLASTISMLLVVIFIVLVRRDLFFDSLISGLVMMLVSTLFYFLIILISNTWVSKTYLDGLSGLRFFTIPVE